MARSALLVVGVLLVVVFVVLVYEGYGVYANITPVTGGYVTTSSTVTSSFASSTTTVTSNYLYLLSQLLSNQTVYTQNDMTYTCPQHGQCTPPVQIFTQPGPILTGSEYCSYYEVYYGTSNCPISASGVSNWYESWVPLTFSGELLVNLSFVNVPSVIQIRVLLILILGVLFLILYATRRKRVK